MKKVNNKFANKSKISSLTAKIDLQLMDLLVNELEYFRSKNPSNRQVRIA